MELVAEGRIIVLEASPEHFQRHSLAGRETDGLVELTSTVAGVAGVVLFSEVDPGKVKVSMRSTGRVSIDQIATRLGGGGHAHAAGVLLRGTRSEAKARVMPDLLRLVDSPDAPAGQGPGLAPSTATPAPTSTGR